MSTYSEVILQNKKEGQTPYFTIAKGRLSGSVALAAVSSSVDLPDLDSEVRGILQFVDCLRNEHDGTCLPDIETINLMASKQCQLFSSSIQIHEVLLNCFYFLLRRLASGCVDIRDAEGVKKVLGIYSHDLDGFLATIEVSKTELEGRWESARAVAPKLLVSANQDIKTAIDEDFLHLEVSPVVCAAIDMAEFLRVIDFWQCDLLTRIEAVKKSVSASKDLINSIRFSVEQLLEINSVVSLSRSVNRKIPSTSSLEADLSLFKRGRDKDELLLSLALSISGLLREKLSTDSGALNSQHLFVNKTLDEILKSIHQNFSSFTKALPDKVTPSSMLASQRQYQNLE